MQLTPWEEHLKRERDQELWRLRHHWGDAYVITWSDGQFHAKRRDNGAMVHRPTAREL
jgi:hypothetical protein